MEWLAAALIACLLTLFDLDRTFTVPKRTQDRAKLYGWWVGFIVINGALAVALYFLVKDASPFKDWEPWLGALVVGAGYLAIIHSKFTTFPFAGKQVPFGFELVYQGGKDFAYTRINRIAMVARILETDALAAATTLAALSRRAKLRINQDALLTPEDKRQHMKWVYDVVRDAKADDMEKRDLIATYVLYGQRTE